MTDPIVERNSSVFAVASLAAKTKSVPALESRCKAHDSILLPQLPTFISMPQNQRWDKVHLQLRAEDTNSGSSQTAVEQDSFRKTPRRAIRSGLGEGSQRVEACAAAAPPGSPSRC